MIITLCGSARFEDWFHAWNEALTVAGHTVFSLATLPSVKGMREWYDEPTKVALDAAHRRKIDASDAILVLNAYAYIGDSTLAEIRYASEQGKKVYFLESWGEGLGLSRNHTKVCLDEAREYFGGYHATFPASPIDTFGGPSVWSILGAAGSFERTAALRALPEKFR
jgi:hypothetical protein